MLINETIPFRHANNYSTSTQCVVCIGFVNVDPALTHANISSLIEPEFVNNRVMSIIVLTLNELKSLGAHISLVDFGTGYSSLSYLKHFPFDILKIDQSFVRDLTQSTDSVAIVTAILALAKVLQLEVIAEGVESDAQ